MEEKIRGLRNEITSHFSLGRTDQGDILLAEGESILPEHVKLECLGNRHFYLRNFQSAVECYEASINIQPDYPIARYQYLVGIQEERSGDLVAAFKRYQAAIEMESSFVDPYVELSGLLTKVGDFQGAAQCYRDAIRLDPSDVANCLNLKTVLTKLCESAPEQYAEELAEIDAVCAVHDQAAVAKGLAKRQW